MSRPKTEKAPTESPTKRSDRRADFEGARRTAAPGSLIPPTTLYQKDGGGGGRGEMWESGGGARKRTREWRIRRKNGKLRHTKALQPKVVDLMDQRVRESLACPLKS